MNRHMPVESTAAVAIWRLRESSTWPSGLSGSTKPPTLRMLVAIAYPAVWSAPCVRRRVGDADALHGARIVGRAAPGSSPRARARRRTPCRSRRRPSRGSRPSGVPLPTSPSSRSAPSRVAELDDARPPSRRRSSRPSRSCRGRSRRPSGRAGRSTSRSAIPQLPPCDQTVSYSGCFVTYLPVGVVEDAGALDDAAAMAGVGREAAALRLELRLRLAADLGRARRTGPA